VGEEGGYTVFVEPKEVNVRRRHRLSYEDNITRDLKDIWGARTGSVWLNKNRIGGIAENVLEFKKPLNSQKKLFNTW